MKNMSGIGISLFALTAALALAPTVAAQTAPAEPDQLEEIVVTSFRRGLAQGVDVKRNADQFLDSIVAEDIGKLPDTNVAESLQRVSGVQIKRGIGEGSSVSIRGLNQNLILMNNRSIVDAAGRGGSGLDSTETGSYSLLALLPSELISRLDVTKQPSADQQEGGIGGTVNIVTRRPLDSGELNAASLEGIYNDRSEKMSYRGSALISRTFNDDTLGVLLNASYSDRNFREDSFFSFSGYVPLTASFNSNPAGIKFDPNGDGTPAYFLSDLRFQKVMDERKRLGANGSVQWKPTEVTEFWAETLYSNQEVSRDRVWLGIPLSGNGSAYSAVTMSPTETLMAGTLSTQVQGNFEGFANDGDFSTSTVGGKWKGDTVEVSAEGSYTYARQDIEQIFLRVRTLSNYSIGFDLRDTDTAKVTLPAGLDLTNPALFAFSNVYDTYTTTIAKEKAAQADLKWTLDAGILSALKVGARYANLDYQLRTNDAQLAINPVIPTAGRVSETRVADLSDLLNGASGSFPRAVLLGVPFAAGTDHACTAFIPTCDVSKKNFLGSFSTTEDIYAAYGRIDLAGDLGDVPFSGNIGARYTKTKLNAVGVYQAQNGTYQPLDTKVDYDDILPSAILKFDLSEKLVARVGAAKVMSRPSSSNLSPNLALNYTVNTGSAGNPNLNPFRADQFDASMEYYLGPESLLSAGLFYKKVKSFISTRVTFEPVPGQTAPFAITRKYNGSGGTIQGIELQYQQPFTFLPEPLDGFGIMVNYAYIESDTPYVNRRTGEKLPIEGLSKQNTNLILYYEKDEFGVRLAYNWRDKYLDRIGSGGDGVFFDSYSDLSVSTRYQLTEDWSVDAQVANVLDEGLRKYGGVSDATALYALSGRTYSVALRGKF